LTLLGKGAKIVAQWLPRRSTRSPGATRVAQAVFAHCGVKVVATHQVDFANAVADATKSTLDMSWREPVGDRVWADRTSDSAPAERRFIQLGLREGEGVRLRRRRDARRARKGGPEASLADASYNNCARIAADQLLQFFGAKKRSIRTRSGRPDPGHADHRRERPEDRGRVP
jgi:hypothetical protein